VTPADHFTEIGAGGVREHEQRLGFVGPDEPPLLQVMIEKRQRLGLVIELHSDRALDETHAGVRELTDGIGGRRDRDASRCDQRSGAVGLLESIG
jgi:hypothetical protein